MALYKGSEAIAGLAINKTVTGFNIFDCKWSDHLINDIQWLRADTFSWQSGDVYVTAYNKLVEEWNNNTGEGTQSGTGYKSFTFRRTANHFKIVSAEAEQSVLDKYNADGMAWYYILDIPNKRFKLPRTKMGFEGWRNYVGNDIAQSLPDHTHSYTADSYWGSDGSSAHLASWSAGDSTRTGWSGTATFTNASASNSTYKSGAIVQERATQMYLYFYVGEYTRDAIEQTSGLNAELFNGKQDTLTATQIEATKAVYLKTTYVSSTSGYNIWSNGYCEQWGRHSSTGDSTFTVTFAKTFKNTNYNLSQWLIETTNNNNCNNGVVIRTLSADKFTYASYDYKPTVMWRACGYLAAGQY